MILATVTGIEAPTGKNVLRNADSGEAILSTHSVVECQYKLGINTKKMCTICNKPISKKVWAKKVLTDKGTYGYMHLDCDSEWLAKHKIKESR
jgi:hypothetical protein